MSKFYQSHLTQRKSSESKYLAQISKFIYLLQVQIQL